MSIEIRETGGHSGKSIYRFRVYRVWQDAAGLPHKAQRGKFRTRDAARSYAEALLRAEAISRGTSGITEFIHQ